MASSSTLYFLFCVSIIAFCISTTTSEAPRAFTLAIKKDDETLQYFTKVQIGVGSTPIDVVVDIGGQSLWFNMDSGGYNSSSFQYASCDYSQCPTNDLTVLYRTCFPISNSIPPCERCACGIDDYNPILMGVGSYANQASIINSFLGMDVLIINSIDVTQRGRRINVPVAIPNFQLSYVPSTNVRSLVHSARGVVGLGNTPTSLPMQLSTMYNLPNQFSICLPSSSSLTGSIFIGVGNQSASHRGSLLTTQIVPKWVNENLWPDDMPPFEYYIPVESIEIGGKGIPFDSSLLYVNDDSGFGGVRLSTVIPFTVLHSDIYEPFVSAFVEKATAMKIRQVNSVGRFGACFDSKTIKKVANGEYYVPAIDLVLQGNKWTIYGHNSLKKVNNNVMCLAFVDGGTFYTSRVYGKSLRSSVVVGGHQLENIYMEFEVDASVLRFSPSLLTENSSCSHLRGNYL